MDGTPDDKCPHCGKENQEWCPKFCPNMEQTAPPDVQPSTRVVTVTAEAIEANVKRIGQLEGALEDYQRLSRISRPSAVVDEVDALNERHKALLQMRTTTVILSSLDVAWQEWHSRPVGQHNDVFMDRLEHTVSRILEHLSDSK